MEYKLLYGVVTLDDGEPQLFNISPMLYDSRNIVTRDKIISVIKDIGIDVINQRLCAYNECNAEEDTLTKENTAWHTRNSTNIVERGLTNFNQMNNLTLIASMNKEYDHFDLFASILIFETSPNHIKTDKSDWSLAQNFKTAENYSDLENVGLKVKNSFWTSMYVSVPDYDYDERNEIRNTYSAISKNFLGLLEHELNTFMNEACYFCSNLYGTEYSIARIKNEMTTDTGLIDRSIDVFRDTSKVNVIRNILYNGYNIALIEDSEGMVFYNRIILVPVVSYYNTGDKQCGEN